MKQLNEKEIKLRKEYLDKVEAQSSNNFEDKKPLTPTSANDRFSQEEKLEKFNDLYYCYNLLIKDNKVLEKALCKTCYLLYGTDDEHYPTYFKKQAEKELGDKE